MLPGKPGEPGRSGADEGGRPIRRPTAGPAHEPPQKPHVDFESVLGGADAVEKTTYVVRDGTDPNARTPVGDPPSAGRTRGNPLLWAVVVIAAWVAPVYVLGIVR